MTDAIAIVAAALAVLGAAVLGLVVPPSRTRSWALVAAIALTVLFAQNGTPVALRNASMGLAAVLLVIGELRAGRRDHGSRTPLVLSIAWWSVVGLVAVLAGTYSTQRLLVQVALVVAFGWVVSRATRADIRALAHTLVVLACLQSVSAVLEVMGALDPLWGLRGDIERMNPLLGDAVARSQGTFGHPLILGFFQGLVLVLAWANPGGMRPSVRFGAIGLIMLGAVLSGTRSALLAAAVAIAVHLLLRFSLVAWIRGAVALVLIVVVIGLVDPGVSDLVARTIDSGSWIHRWGSLQAVPVLLERPGWIFWWGTGYGSETLLFEQGILRDRYGLPVVDNFVVYLLGTTGVIGLTSALALLVTTFVMGRRWVKALAVFVFGMWFSFDVTVWLSSGILMFLVVALAGSTAGRAPKRARVRATDHESNATHGAVPAMSSVTGETLPSLVEWESHEQAEPGRSAARQHEVV